MANIITGIRIICGILILFFPAFSQWYCALYLLGGFTDAIDGTVARKLGKESAFGAKFDTAADIAFAVAVAVKIAKEVMVPAWLWIWIGIIMLIKVMNVVVGIVKYRRFVAVHSVLNKVCGGVIYFAALFIGAILSWKIKNVVLGMTCVLATVAAVAESIKVYRGSCE